MSDWVENPESFKIARMLQAEKCNVCIHNRTQCYSTCGVSYHSGVWYVIPYSVRRFHAPPTI